MANNLTYLFELDSVRTTPAHINAGLQSLFDEIVINGNTVVLTYNQMCDSAIFYELMNKARQEKDGKTFENLVSLFQNGALKISQFGSTRTIVQYLINSLESNTFVYSVWPLTSTQPHLCALIKRSLETCDLTELSYFKGNNVSDSELIRLFIDTCNNEHAANNVNNTSNVNAANNVNVNSNEASVSCETRASMREKIDMMYWLVRFVLRISIIPDIYLPPKEQIPRAFTLYELLRFIVSRNIDPEVNNLATLSAYKEKKNDRSAYEDDIKVLAVKTCNLRMVCKIRLVLDLCYNYASEYSIFGISLHYPVCQDVCAVPDDAFLNDFMTRFTAELASIESVGFDKTLETRDAKYDASFSKASSGDAGSGKTSITFPNFDAAVAATQLSQKKYKLAYQNKACVYVSTYEHDFSRTKKQHRKNLFGGFLSRIALLLLCLFIAVCIDFSTGAFEDVVTSHIPFSDVVTVMLETLVFLLVSEYVTVLLSRKIPQFVSLSDAIAEVVVAGKNAFRTFTHARTHQNNKVPAPTHVQTAAHAHTSNTTQTTAHLQTADTTQTSGNPSFSAASRSRKDTSKLWFPTLSKSLRAARDVWEHTFSEEELAAYEEVHNKNLGLVYSSEYHNFYVDPLSSNTTSSNKAVKNNTNSPHVTGFYERLENKNSGAVVVICVHKGKFVFLKQFRHSIAAKTYALPRGFGEPNISAQDNVIKELSEELQTTVLHEPVYLGVCYPDTGITSSCAQVYVVEIGEYALKSGYEGIEEVVLASPEEVYASIAQGAQIQQASNAEGVSVQTQCPFELTDGFSLSAFALLGAKLHVTGMSLAELLETKRA